MREQTVQGTWPKEGSKQMREDVVEGYGSFMKTILPHVKSLNNGSTKVGVINAADLSVLAAATPSMISVVGKPMRSVNLAAMTIEGAEAIIRTQGEYVVIRSCTLPALALLIWTPYTFRVCVFVDN